jgi:hypothetical protein
MSNIGSSEPIPEGPKVVLLVDSDEAGARIIEGFKVPLQKARSLPTEQQPTANAEGAASLAAPPTGLTDSAIEGTDADHPDSAFVDIAGHAFYQSLAEAMQPGSGIPPTTREVFYKLLASHPVANVVGVVNTRGVPTANLIGSLFQPPAPPG